MSKLRRVIPLGLAIVMSMQGIPTTIPVIANTTNNIATTKKNDKTTPNKKLLKTKERIQILQQINSMNPKDGRKLAKETGLIKNNINSEKNNLKKATVNTDAKEGEVGYQFTQDQYIDETHRIRYEYTITDKEEVSAQYIKGIVYENGSPMKKNDKEVTYQITDKLTYPASVTLDNITYRVTDAKLLNVTAKHLIIPEGVETCWSSSHDFYTETMTIPSTLKEFDGPQFSYNDDFYYAGGKEKFVFKGYTMSNPEKAKYLTVEDGIVYNKDKTELATPVPERLEKDILILPDTLKKIPEESFLFSRIKKVICGKNITSIGRGAFDGSDIEEILMNDKITSLGEFAFTHCEKLKHVELSAGIKTLSGWCTFGNTKSLTHIDLKNITTLDGTATFISSGLKDIDISNVSDLTGEQPFVGSDNLKTVYIGKNTDFTGNYGLGTNPFAGCCGLEKYVEKEKNQHYLYTENGKLYASQMVGSMLNVDGDDYNTKYVTQLYHGKILVGYPFVQLESDAKKNDGCIKFSSDITQIAKGANLEGSHSRNGSGTNSDVNDIDVFFKKLIIPSSVQAIDLIMTSPGANLEIDFYGDTFPLIDEGLCSEYMENAKKDDAVLGTKTFRFKSKNLCDKFNNKWKSRFCGLYKNEKVVTDVLPDKKTTSLTLNKTSNTVLCDGKTYRIRLLAKLSQEDCTDIVTFKSSNENVATIDAYGDITTKKYHPGKTTITAIAGDYKATYELTQTGSGMEASADQKTVVYNEWEGTWKLFDTIKKGLSVYCADCHTQLKEDIDYEVIISDYKKTGKAKVTAKGIGVFKGLETSTTVNVEYHKHGENGYYISDYSYSGYDWTGKPITPTPKIYCTDCHQELKEGTDYKFEYENNVNVGTAILKVIGMGNYAGFNQKFDFTIKEACGWNGFYATNNEEKVINGGDLGTHNWSDESNKYLPFSADFKCNHCGRTLTKGKDYIIAYPDVIKPGKVTVKVTGIGSYVGYSSTYTYTVKPKDFEYQGNLECNWKGPGKESNVDLTDKIVHWNNSIGEYETLVEGKDYKVEYSNNKEIGTGIVKVIGLGDYIGYEKTINYTINMPHGWNGFCTTFYKDGDDIGQFSWKKDGVKPYIGSVLCKDDWTILTENKDYTISYSNTTKPGKSKIIIKNTGNYQGKAMTLYYTIMPREFSLENVHEGESIGTYIWTGKEIKPEIKNLVNESGEILTEGFDYKIEYPNNMIDDGKKIIKIIGLGDYVGREQTYCYYIEKTHGWNGFHSTSYENGADLGTFSWTGEKIRPSVGNLICNHCGFLSTDSWLYEGIDYKVELNNPYGPGKASIKIIGINRYSGHELNFTYTIKNKTFSFGNHKNDDYLGTMEYTGKEIKYPIENIIDITGKTLTEGIDYKLIYFNNIKQGIAKVQIIGLDDYEGCTLNFTYRIIGFGSNLYEDGADLGSYAYTGREITPFVGLIYFYNVPSYLTKGVDYKVEYHNNINPGIAIAKVIGIGRYAGHEMSFTYTIENKSFSAKDHKDGENLGTLKWTGKAQTMTLGDMIDPIDGHALKEGTDYKIVYSNNIDAGTAKAEVIGLGYYEGSRLIFYYTIEKQHGWNGFYAKGHKDGESLGTFKWTGNSILIDPDMRCSHCDKELQENVDYKVEYSDNINPGVASMKVIGMGDYEGYELNFTFVIEKKDPATTEDQKPTTTTTETKPTTGTTESSSATSETKPTTGTTESTTTTTTEDKTTTTTESKPTTEDKTTATTESKPTTSSTTTETKPGTEAPSTSGTTTTEKRATTTAAPVVKITVKKAAIQKIKALKKAFTINILKNKDQVTGYQISYSYKKNFKGQKVKELKKCKYKNIKVKRKKYTITSCTIKKLKKKKTVYVRVRAYKQVGDTKVYGKWSSVKKVIVK